MNGRVVDDRLVREVVSERCAGISIASVRVGPSGYSSRMWVAETDEGPLLVRVPVRNPDPERLRAMIVATRLANEAGIPTIRFRDLAAGGPAGPFLIQEFRAGTRASDLVGEATDLLAAIGHELGTWAAALHRIGRRGFGPILGGARFPVWRDFARQRVQDAIDLAASSGLHFDVSRVIEIFDAVIARVPDDIEPSLVHGDLYLDNVLIHDGRPTCLLDFEHACFADRFVEFGKINELLFEWWPGIKAPFLAAYQETYPPEPGDGARISLAIGLYELSQLAYFARWQPDLIPTYRDRLDRWAATTEAKL